MSSSSQERNNFGQAFLDTVLEWVASEMAPQDVFEESTLLDWAMDQDLEKVFGADTLSEWAKDNGFTKEEA